MSFAALWLSGFPGRFAANTRPLCRRLSSAPISAAFGVLFPVCFSASCVQAQPAGPSKLNNDWIISHP
ncbi:hypothetical protein A7X67_07740 [Clostridium sp. W14A]|nr:hypothetical protein A7X67_07740 [Clostridium sp. W14A]